ncbi:ATP phosphoribosyltransferase regulatory subunit [Kordiimonas sediminis]|uniref:ATP phosphoribosyltransferase regulatory subunit n=1 Tax=Kordiimonas sediminis TaxID=1735581 RepID=A0A919E7X3_9PROT|nr:ATP phosphoribosyltransferase regulatory subunit [Kordiimonas sediminis]GHF23430.1 ATP phosphoribosyltransferase regulatory subunit [Kordiimonas sediminis]
MTGPFKKMTGNAYARQALLPGGFRDVLAPAADYEYSAVRQLLKVFGHYGYDRVSPPLVEYEDSLLTGPGSTHANQMFRLMDTDTQKVMAVRADMTVQMSRLAATRLQNAPRPLRLAYAGNVLRVKGSQLRPARQFMQVGFELIGSDALEAELEVIKIAVEALESVGIRDLSIDLTVAPFIRELLTAFDLEGDDLAQTVSALSAKDAHGFDALPDKAATIFSALISAAGSAREALSVIEGLTLPKKTGTLIKRVRSLVDAIEESMPSVAVTFDPSETHGFEYKTGIGFAIFARGSNTELGRGGRYHVDHPDIDAEEATGFSVYMDTLMSALPAPKSGKKLFIPVATPAEMVKRLHSDGWRTIQGLTETADASKEARRLLCSHIYLNGSIQPLD